VTQAAGRAGNEGNVSFQIKTRKRFHTPPCAGKLAAQAGASMLKMRRLTILLPLLQQEAIDS
jgi:hypothetical protein